MLSEMNRRKFLKDAALASAGIGLGMSFEERALLAAQQAGPVSKATGDAPAQMPMGKIGDLEISQLICGGNLIGGWAHSRELLYVSELVVAYHTDEKVFETLELAEELGVNTILTNPKSDEVIKKYWRQWGGRIQWISDCAWGDSLIEGIKRSIDSGAHAVYIQGGLADEAVQEGKIEQLGQALDFIKKQGVPGGLGAHVLETVVACEEAGLEPDFWMKTLHTDNYFSATPTEKRQKSQLPPHDNMWCTNPDETIAYMKGLKRPWIAFKVLAAGAIKPEDGFLYAFEGGADFICVGMFDFQVREDVAIAKQILASGLTKRQRPYIS